MGEIERPLVEAPPRARRKPRAGAIAARPPSGVQLPPESPHPDASPHRLGPAVQAGGDHLVREEPQPVPRRGRDPMAGDEPRPERVRGPRWREGRDRGRVQGIRRRALRCREVHRRQIVQHRGRLARALREPHEGPRGIRPPFRDGRQHPVPEVVPVVLGGAVARILHPLETPAPGASEDLGPRDREEGPHQPQAADHDVRPHGRHPGRPRAPQDAEQRRLRLVVPVMGEEHRRAGGDHFRERGVAGRPGGRFEPSAPGLRGDRGAAHLQPDPEPCRRPSAMVLPGAGIGMEPVVDVDGGQALRRPAAENPRRGVEQDGGVHPPAERDPPGLGLRERAGDPARRANVRPYPPSSPPALGFGERSGGTPHGGGGGAGPGGAGADHRPHRIEDLPVRRRRHGPSGARSGAR